MIDASLLNTIVDWSRFLAFPSLSFNQLLRGHVPIPLV